MGKAVDTDKTLDTQSKGGKIVKGFDILKVVMAFVVVSIHSEIADGFTNEVLCQLGYSVNSLAVPVFFVISSFLFFSRYRSVVRGGGNELIYNVL